MRSIVIWLVSIYVCMTVFIPEPLCSAEKFGLFFEIEGKVKLVDPAGRTSTLSRAKDLLRPVMEGDRIEVAEGKAVVVSFRENKGYEFAPNSAGRVKAGKMLTVKGRIIAKDGLSVPRPDKRLSGVSGTVVVRSVTDRCISIQSPAETAIIELAPVLRWRNLCEETKKVTVTVLGGKEVKYTAQTERKSIKVPEGILKYGNKYRWTVKSGDIEESAAFSIPEEKEFNEI